MKAHMKNMLLKLGVAGSVERHEDLGSDLGPINRIKEFLKGSGTGYQYR